MGLERDKSELERKVERSNLENRSTLQMMASLQEVEADMTTEKSAAKTQRHNDATTQRHGN